MLKIITDSASDIVDNTREDLTVLPVTITFGEEQFQDGVNLTHRMFYEKLIECDELPVTSQVAPFAFEEAYRRAKEQGDKVIVITLSSLRSAGSRGVESPPNSSGHTGIKFARSISPITFWSITPFSLYRQ